MKRISDWLKVVPFVKIFILITIGVVSANVIKIDCHFAPLALTLVGIISSIIYRGEKSVIVAFTLAIFGVWLGSYSRNQATPLNRYTKGNFVVVDTTSKAGIYLTQTLPSGKSSLLIIDKEQLAVGDTLTATVLFDELRYAHFTLRNLTTSPNNFYTARVIKCDTIIKGVDYIPKAPSIIDRANSWAEARVKGLSIDPRDVAIINGMILGNRDEIDGDTKELFSATSLSHTLAISGMHIAIIFMLLNSLLRPLRQSFKGRVIISIVVVLVLWCYTLIVGAPISALRATTMFTLMQVALLHSNSAKQIYNSLFATATFMVIYDSTLLYDIGFQLSFMAVLSIIITMPILQQLTAKRYLVLDAVYVTIGAQLLTAPIVLYYFGTISFVSVFCNIFAGVLVALIATLAMIYIAAPNTFIEQILGYLFSAIRTALEYISQLTFSHIDDIEISILGVLLYYLVAAKVIKLGYDYINVTKSSRIST